MGVKQETIKDSFNVFLSPQFCKFASWWIIFHRFLKIYQATLWWLPLLILTLLFQWQISQYAKLFSARYPNHIPKDMLATRNLNNSLPLAIVVMDKAKGTYALANYKNCACLKHPCRAILNFLEKQRGYEIELTPCFIWHLMGIRCLGNFSYLC